MSVFPRQKYNVLSVFPRFGAMIYDLLMMVALVVEVFPPHDAVGALRKEVVKLVVVSLLGQVDYWADVEQGLGVEALFKEA